MDEAQAGIKIAGRNVNNLRYEHDTTLTAESEEELKSLLMKMKEENLKAGLKLSIHVNVWQNTLQYCKVISLQLIKINEKTKKDHAINKDHGIWSHHFMANRWRNNGNSDRLYFLGLQNHCRWWLQPWNEKMLVPQKKSYDKLSRQHIKKQRHYFAKKGSV